MKLLSINADAKTIKGVKAGFLTGVMYMAPADLSGHNVCPQASAGCKTACLGWYAGRANIIKRGDDTNTIRDSRLEKTKLYFDDRATFMNLLVKEIKALVRKAKREGLTPVVRLNGSSDIAFERVTWGLNSFNIMDMFPDVQFYDYTKVTKRALAFAKGNMPKNYHVTFSATEDNGDACADVLLNGGNVAMVFDKVPGMHIGYTVIDGDETDLRFKDKAGVIVGLKAKGDAKNDKSGFVRRAA